MAAMIPALQIEAEQLVTQHGRRAMQMLADRATELVRHGGAACDLDALGQLISAVYNVLVDRAVPMPLPVMRARPHGLRRLQ